MNSNNKTIELIYILLAINLVLVLVILLINHIWYRFEKKELKELEQEHGTLHKEDNQQEGIS